VPVASKLRELRDHHALSRMDRRLKPRWRSVVYCGGTVAVKWELRAKLAVTQYCNAWPCPECQPKRRNRLISDLMRGHPNTMITLPMRPIAGMSADSQAKLLSDSFKALRKLIHREARRDLNKTPFPFGAAPEEGWHLNDRGYIPRQVNLIGGKFEYGAVFELTKIGTPHLHVVARVQWIAQAWLSLQWEAYLASPVVHITRARSKKHTVRYVGKYVGKQPARIGKCKRYWFSRGFHIEPKRERRPQIEFGGKWERQAVNLALWCQQQEELGWLIERIDPRTAMSRAPP